ncbi:hypothetical protein [Nocardia exalbida]|uniref:hypothetical protein n=1 Tax=Nocardia exalbida TaxID=290231 RepID=UPI001C3F3010|nr:hypothetical protein [Nocardia exalbida]
MIRRGGPQDPAALGLVHAAERGAIERAALTEFFGAGEIDDAYLQLVMAGVARP